MNSTLQPILTRAESSHAVRPRPSRCGTIFAVALGGAGLLGITQAADSTTNRTTLASGLKALGFEEIALRRTAQNHLYLRAGVNGRRHSCLVDTGWSFTTVATNVSVTVTPSNQLATIMWSGVQRAAIPVRRADLRRQGAPTAYDIVLGADFLKREGVILDLARARMYLRGPHAANPAPAAWETLLKATGRTEVGLKFGTPPTWTCGARINGVEVQWLVDNGAVWSCLDTGAAQAMGLRAQASHQRLSSTMHPGHFAIAVAQVPAWEIAGSQFRGGTVAVFALRELGFGPDGAIHPEVGGIWGATDLIRHEAILDCGTDKLWLRHPRL